MSTPCTPSSSRTRPYGFNPLTKTPTKSPTKTPFNLSPQKYRVSKQYRKSPSHFRTKSLPDWWDEQVVASAMASDAELPWAPQPPSDIEASTYYYGLPSRPKLVARSTTTAWQVQADRWPIGKILSPVGRHPIANMWNSTSPLREEILGCLESISWTAVDILRIGYERPNESTGEEPSHVVTLFISVEPSSTSWSTGHAVVRRCQRTIERYGLSDVNIEMKEGQLHRCVSPATAPTTAPRLSPSGLFEPIDINALFSEFAGVSIAVFEDPSREGTKCLYLRSGDTDKTFALTCRHVVFRDSAVNQDYQHEPSNPRMVIQPGSETFRESKKSVTDQIKRSNKTIDEMAQDTRPGTTRRSDIEKAYRDSFVDVDEKLDLLTSLEARIIGHVAFSPMYGTGTTQSGRQRLRDWALIELHAGKHETPLQGLENRILAGQQAAKMIDEALDSEMHSRDRVTPSVKVDELTCTVLPIGTAPEMFLRRPTIESTSLDEPAIIVAKYGRTTHLTLGLLNEVRSVTRSPLGIYGNTFISEELCIVGCKHTGSTRAPFSAAGDSGSCVWDMEGRICAMMTAGVCTGTNGGMDTTYATPIEWLLNDIKEHGFDVRLV